jgi:hypothetical protein
VQWLTSVILVTQEAEIGRITVQGQPVQKVSKTPIHIRWAWCYVPVIPVTQEVGQSRSEVSPAENHEALPEK